VRNNTFNGIEQEFNSEKNSFLLRAPPLFPKRRAAAGHFGITYESLHFRSLQSLTSAERVNRDGESVDDDDDGSEDGEGDGGKNKVPSGSGAPGSNALQGNRDSSLAVDGDHVLAELSGYSVSELLARTTEAVGAISGDLVGKAEEGKKSDDLSRDNNQESNDEDGAKSSDADEEQNLVAEAIKEVEGVGNKEETCSEQCNEHKSLLDLELLVHARSTELGISLLGSPDDLGVGALDVKGLAEHVEVGLRVVVERGCQGGIRCSDTSVRELNLV
jgi:hypothetical protein